MSRGPLLVLADDLTGAAEIAAIAHRAGLRSVVHTRASIESSNAEVVVVNTETRLLPTAKAGRRIQSLLTRLKPENFAGFFKKTDSVLRGPVLAELDACLAALDRRRALLVPCNPSLGRVIRGGRYFIAGLPLEETAFARDPHHPCKTSEILTLLGAKKDSRVVCLGSSVRLPAAGVIVGNATSSAAIAAWATRVDAHTLPAGGADFFRAWLKQFLRASRTSPKSSSRLSFTPALLLSGTTAAPRDKSPLDADMLFFRGTRPPTLTAVTAKLRRHDFAAVASGKSRSTGLRAPVMISRGFAQLAGQLHRTKTFRHLLIAGGATASAVLEALGWTKLEVIRVWAPGVVTLRPADDPDFLVTLKPGSYAWPAELSRQISPVSRKS
jgi:uncharacterized protein YgbK (DUF1537 family)